MLRDAADASGRVMPPLLLQQEGLMDHIEGPPLPCLATETLVLAEG
jgi:hypothetical protein